MTKAVMLMGRLVAATLVVTFLAGAGCGVTQSDLMAMELELLREKLARLEAERDAVLAAKRADRPRPGRAAGPPEVRAPDPSSPPPLPVVRLKPNADPFADGTEPVVRVGRKLTPPAKKRVKQAKSRSGTKPTKNRDGYDRINENGELVDEDGNVVYRPRPARKPNRAAGTPDEEPIPDRVYEQIDDPHVAPSRIVDKHLQVPKMREPPQPGVTTLPKQRLKEFVIRDRGLPDERDDAIVVQERAPSEPEPVADPEPVRLKVRAKRAKRAKKRSRAKARPKPLGVPGASRVIKQRNFKDRREQVVQRYYRRAMKRLNAGKRESALALFKRIIKYYSEHELADNAIYWSAEIVYSRGDWLGALTWFQEVIVRYPEGNKLPDAMLKSALCYARLGDTSYAVKLLEDIESIFPNNPVAKVARERRLELGDGGS